MDLKTERLHGRTLHYAVAGEGPVLLLIHGMGGGGAEWRAVIEPLAQSHTVIAPDLPGYGRSAPSGDYSVGGLASNLRDLLLVLGHERATFVGHSFGGGVAIQFTHQFPEFVERLVLVSSGGLGQEVSLPVRAVALPGAGWFIAVTAPAVRWAVPHFERHSVLGFGLSGDLVEMANVYALLADRERRNAFLATLRSVVDTRGQRVSAVDRLHLVEDIPVLIIWGSRDPFVPARHGERAHLAIPGSRLEVFDGVGHQPQLQAPAKFLAALERFLDETEPAQFYRVSLQARFRAAPIDRADGGSQ